MSPARVECSDGHNFTLPKGRILDERLSGFEHLTKDDIEDLKWRSIFGTSEGYEIVLWGRQDVNIKISSDTVLSNPVGYEKQVELRKGNIFTLEGGTKISPFRLSNEKVWNVAKKQS